MEELVTAGALALEETATLETAAMVEVTCGEAAGSATNTPLTVVVTGAAFLVVATTDGLSLGGATDDEGCATLAFEVGATLETAATVEGTTSEVAGSATVVALTVVVTGAAALVVAAAIVLGS